jgi:hypothetical protein
MKMSARRQLRSMFLLLLLAGLFFLAANAGKFLELNAPQPSDLILVLAGETDTRPALALDLLQHGFAARVLMDVPARARIYDTTAMQVAESYIRKLPQANQITVCPITGLSTRDESHDVARCVAQQNVGRILIVTSDYHTRRALSIFRHEMPGTSFSIAAAHDDSQFGVRWWTHRQWAKVCLDEWLRLFWWTAIERWL